MKKLILISLLFFAIPASLILATGAVFTTLQANPAGDLLANASAYCATLTTNNYNWALPTISQLETNYSNIPDIGSLNGYYIWATDSGYYDELPFVSGRPNIGGLITNAPVTDHAIYVCTETTSRITQGVLITLPATPTAAFTAIASQFFLDLWPIMVLFVGIPLGFYIAYRIRKLFAKN